MKKTVKFLSLALSALLLSVFAFTGCGKGGDDSTEGPKAYPEEKYTVTEDYIATNAANDQVFSVSGVTADPSSPLKGKTFYWLGSSVTYGSASNGQSVADYLAALTGCVCKKDAVSGTTIFDDGKTAATGTDSYTRRLVNSKVFDKTEKIDGFICQISTNDARNDRLNKRGVIKSDKYYTSTDFDRATTLGGIEFIITYVTETWGCPVYFYSGSYFGDTGTRKSTNPTGTEYAKLVDQVIEIADKYNQFMDFKVGVIDLYNDADFNAVASDKYYKWVMSDAIHPKAAGYLQWWTPYFESYLVYDLT